MSDWNTDYERRLRRVAGVTDDATKVTVAVSSETEYFGGGCDTCSYESTEVCVEIEIDRNVRWSRRGWDAFGELQRALAAVEDD